MNVENFFERVILISLSKRQDRRELFFDALKKTGVNWNVEIFDAIDGLKTGTPELFRGIGAGAFGCWLSHLEILLRAANEGWNNYLVFEDDAIFLYGFCEKLERSLEELPEDWDQFYLGFQPINLEIAKPTVVSDHVWRVGDANRTHAYAIHSRGYEKFIKHLFAFDKKPKGFHVDHWFGVLHRQLDADGYHVVNAYATRPQLVAQREGKSDICDKIKHTTLWECKDEMFEFKKSGNIQVLDSSIGYGKLGTDGYLGYEGKKISAGSETFKVEWISAHAPSIVNVKITRDTEIFGALNLTGSPPSETEVIVDGKRIGTLSRDCRTTKRQTITRGVHRLEFATQDNRSAHTVWGFDVKQDPVIEILSNTLCPRKCSGCNQAAFMAAQPDYEYTPENARALVAALEKFDRYVRVCFTGGEPSIWEQLEEVVQIFNDSERISGNWVVTSDDSEQNITRLKSIFERVCLSRRNGTVCDASADYLRGVTVWDQREHALPRSIEPVDEIDCCCRKQGIVAALIGEDFYPCVVAESLRIEGFWDGRPKVSLEEYFSKGFDQPIGTYDACRSCVNNLNYRKLAQKVST